MILTTLTLKINRIIDTLIIGNMCTKFDKIIRYEVQKRVLSIIYYVTYCNAVDPTFIVGEVLLGGFG